jgi:hypothetical protein
MACVYAHLKPSGEPFYIGKGSLQRARMLVRNKHHSSVVKKYGKPTVQIIASSLTEQEAFNFEKLVIKQLRKQGVKLTNLTDGGEGTLGVVQSIETRQKRSRHMRLVHQDSVYKAQHKEAVKTAMSSITVKTKLVDRFTDDYKARLSVSQIESNLKPDVKLVRQLMTISVNTKQRLSVVSGKPFKELTTAEVRKWLPQTLLAFNIRHGFYCRWHSLPHNPVQPRKIVNEWFNSFEGQIVEQLMEMLNGTCT